MGVPDGADVLLGNGSDELIQILLTAVAGPSRTVLAPEPTFVMYRQVARTLGMRFVGVPLRELDFALDLDAFLAAVAITVDANATVPFAVGDVLYVRQAGIGGTLQLLRVDFRGVGSGGGLLPLVLGFHARCAAPVAGQKQGQANAGIDAPALPRDEGQADHA